MESKRSQTYFLVALLAGALILSFFIIRPFLYSMILGVIFAVVFQPIQRRMLARTGSRHGLAAFLTILIVVLFVLTPITFVGIQVLQEAQQLYAYLSSGVGPDHTFDIFNRLTANLHASYPALASFSGDADQLLKNGLELVLNNLGNIFSSVVRIIGNLFVFLLVLYYVLKDGARLKKVFIAVSPLADADDEAIYKNLGSAINSVVKGNLMISIIQGILVAVGFTIFGIPQAVLWGTVAAVAALIPTVGTALVLGPAIIFLFINGHTGAAIGLLAWGVLAVGLIDNLLGPKLVSRGLHLHPLLVLLSVLGGIAFFGPTGFLLGPLTLSLVFALVKIYSTVYPKRIA